jgi:hypothetical protein
MAWNERRLAQSEGVSSEVEICTATSRAGRGDDSNASGPPLKLALLKLRQKADPHPKIGGCGVTSPEKPILALGGQRADPLVIRRAHIT